MKPNTIFIALVFICLSLISLYPQSFSPTEIESIADTNPRLALQHIESSIRPSTDCDSARLYFLAGVIHAQLGSMDKARISYQRSLPCAVLYGRHSDQVEILSNIAYTYEEEGRSDLALDFHHKALKICKREKLYNWMAYTYLGLADIYHYWEDTSRVMSSLSSAEESFELDPDPIVKNWLVLAWMPYQSIPLDSFAYIHAALDGLKRYKDMDTYIYGHVLLTKKFRSMGESDSTLKYAERARNLSDLYDYPLYHHMATGSMALIYQKQGKFRSAIRLLKPIARLSKYDDYASGAHYQLYQNYNALQLKDSALHHLEIYDSIEYSKSLDSKLGNLADLDLKFQIDETSELLSEQNRKNRRMLFGFITGLVVLFLSGLVLWQRLKFKRKAREIDLRFKREQERLEIEKYKELDEIKTRFFTNASHELRTPLTLIIDPLQNYLSGNQTDKNHLNLALRNSKKLLRLVNGIMEISKIEAGKVVLKNEEFGIKEFVEQILFLFSSLAGQKGLELAVSNTLQEDAGLNLDKSKLRTVLDNILSNALKYSDRNGMVQVGIDEDDGDVVISVQDEGNGISNQDIKRVFDRYYRSTTTEDSIGTGIGLSLSKELIELLGASISVQSELGVGSIFTIRIPQKYRVSVVEMENGEHVDDSNIPGFSLSKGRYKILVVEDNLEMSNYLCDILKGNYLVDVAKDGLEGLQMIQKAQYSLILSDIMMPQMSGLELRERINKIPRLRTIPYIFLTARNSQEQRLEGLSLGVDDYITKPFDSTELLTRIENLLIRRIEMESVGEREILIDEPDESQFFIEKAEKFVTKNIMSPDLSVSALAQWMNYSSKQLNRHLKAHVGMTAVEFILEVRMQLARDMIENQHDVPIQAVTDKVGISSASYFSRKFRERYGQSPIKLREKFSA